MKELEIGLRQMANMKCANSDGIVVEMIKYSSDIIKKIILDEFNMALQSGIFQENWHHTIFQILPKDDDLTKVSN